MPKPHPQEFRDDVIAIARKGEARLRQIAKDFGISEACLHRWLKIADREDGRGQPAHHGGAVPAHGGVRRKERRMITEEFTKNRDCQILLATDAADTQSSSGNELDTALWRGAGPVEDRVAAYHRIATRPFDHVRQMASAISAGARPAAASVWVTPAPTAASVSSPWATKIWAVAETRARLDLDEHEHRPVPGDEIEFTITTDIPNVAVIDGYRIVDDLDAKLDYVSASVSLSRRIGREKSTRPLRSTDQTGMVPVG